MFLQTGKCDVHSTPHVTMGEHLEVDHAAGRYYLLTTVSSPFTITLEQVIIGAEIRAKAHVISVVFLDCGNHSTTTERRNCDDLKAGVQAHSAYSKSNGLLHQHPQHPQIELPPEYNDILRFRT